MNKYNWRFKRAVNLTIYRLRHYKKIVRLIVYVISFTRNAGFLVNRRCDNKIRKAISEKNKFIYLGNPKVATRSILSFLESQQYSDLVVTEKTVEQLRNSIIEYDDYFSFTFVRNPWARAYSCWKDKITTQTKFCDIFILTKYRGLYPDMPFEEFVKWLASENGSDDFADRHWLSQYELLKNEQGKISIDFIGKSEQIAEDFKTLLQHLKIDESLKLSNSNATAEKRDQYKTAYTPYLKKMIYERYKKDIEVFGYDF